MSDFFCEATAVLERVTEETPLSEKEAATLEEAVKFIERAKFVIDFFSSFFLFLYES